MHSVLIVEDSPVLKRLLEVTLRHPDLAIDSVVTANGCRTAMSRKHYDVVVLDVGLPDGSGMDVLAWIRSDAERDDTQIVMASGIADSNIVKQSLDGGAAAYLIKPYSPDDVRRVVWEMLQRPVPQSA